MPITVQIDPVSERDSLELWRTKTNQVIESATEVAANSTYSSFIDSQFKHNEVEQNGLLTTFETGTVRRRTTSRIVPKTSIELVPRAKNLVYIDYYGLDSEPLKTLPIEFEIETNLPYTIQLGNADITSLDDIRVSVMDGGVLTELVGQASDLVISATDQYWIDYDNNTITFQSVDSPAVAISKNTRIYLTSSIGDVISKPDIVPIYVMDTDSTSILSSVDLRTWVYTNTYNTPLPAVPGESVFYVEEETDTLVLSTSADECVVYFDGVRQILDVDYIQTASNAIKSNSVLPVGTQVTVVTYSSSGSENVYAISDTKIATVNGQTDFVITNFQISAGTYLWVNGIRQSPSSYSVDANTNTITLSSGVPAGTSLFAFTNVFSSTGFVFVGGTAGQIAKKLSSIDDDWIWVDPEFDASVFTSGTFDGERFPFIPWFFSNPLYDNYTIAPQYLKYIKTLSALDTWEKNFIGKSSDFHITGQNAHTFRGEGHKQLQQYYWTPSGYSIKDMDYYETYAAQKYGRIVKNAYDLDNAFTKTDVPNAPFLINDITLTRQNPIDRTAVNAQRGYLHLIAVGDSGKIAYNKNLVTSSLAKDALFDVWKEIPQNSLPFNSNWNIVSVESIIFDKRVEVAPKVTKEEGWDIIFIAAHNPTTGKSNVAWKLGVDIDNFTVAWNYLHGATGITGKVTNIGAINTDDSRCVAWAIGNTVYGMIDQNHAYGKYTDLVLSRDATASKPTVTYVTTPFVLQSTTFGDVDEVATLIHCTPVWNNPNASTGAFWSIATESGNVYVRASYSYTLTSEPFWNPAKPNTSGAAAYQRWQKIPNFDDSGNIQTILSVGSTDQYPDSNPPQRATYYLGNGISKSIGYHNGLTSGYEIVPRPYSTLQCGYLMNAPSFVEGNVVSGIQNQSPYHEGPNAYHSNKMIVQSEAGDIALVDYAIGSTYSLDFMNVKQIKAFTSEKSPVPPVNILGVISNGVTQICAATSPVNCLWIMTGEQQGGTPMPVSGDIFGMFYEGNRFIIVTSKYIYSAGDNLVWSKFTYIPNSDSVSSCDLTHTSIGSTNIWFLANGYDSAYSTDGITWSYYSKSTTGSLFKPTSILNSVVSFGGPAGSTVVGFYDGRGLTPANQLGQVLPPTYNGINIGYLAPVAHNLNSTTWLFNLRDLTVEPSEIKTIKLTGIFQNSAGSVGTTQESLVISSQDSVNFDVTRDSTTTSKNYGTTFRWDFSYPNGARYMVSGNSYELLINNIYIGSLTFDPNVPQNTVTSAGEGVIMGIDVNGRIVRSVNGTSWEEYPDSYIDRYDLTDLVGSEYIQPTTEETKFTSIQYNEYVKGYTATRRNGISVVIYDNGEKTAYVNKLNTLGSVYDTTTIFDDGEYITELSGKKFILFARTNRERLFFGVSGSGWYILNVPIHSVDIPSTVTYDNLGNHFITSRKLNNISGELPAYYRMTF